MPATITKLVAVRAAKVVIWTNKHFRIGMERCAKRNRDSQIDSGDNGAASARPTGMKALRQMKQPPNAI
jgi:hypothetical protein